MPLVCTGRLRGEARSAASLAAAAGVPAGLVLDLGFVEGGDLPALYRAARAVVFPSLFEGFGMPVLEAMAVAAPWPAPTCAAGRGGRGAVHRFDPLDAGAIARALREVWEDEPLRARLRRDGLERAAEYPLAAVVPALVPCTSGRRGRRRMSGATRRRACWCGCGGLSPFGPRYGRCADCGTLVALRAPDLAAPAAGREAGFYGCEYWREHQERDLGLPPIAQRARDDLSGRCLHWLQALLAHRLPPARVLEVGCGHGGFVALLRLAGFDATGLELSPWVVEFARRTFDVPVLLGPIERQDVVPGSLDVIVMNDVVEHLPDPVGTMARVAALLAPGGLLMLQTPCAPEDASHAQLERAGDSFLKMMQEEGHLYLFSRRAIARLLEPAGLRAVHFERAYFGYDMALLAGAQAVPDAAPGDVDAALQATPSGRMALALLDKARESESRRQRSIAQLLGPTVSRRLAGVLRRLRLV